MHPNNAEAAEYTILSSRLGSGAYSDVYLGLHNKEEVAMKVLRRSKGNPIDEANNEASIMKDLKHQNIVKCYDAFVNREGEAVIVMERGERPLLAYLRERYVREGRPTAALVKDYALQLCYAVKYLHDHDISHGDLCLKNIVVDREGRLKLCDFGYAMVLQNGVAEDRQHRCSPFAAAPELLRTWRRTTATDMYAVGITLLELVLHDAAYSATNLSQYETNGYYDINAFCRDVIDGLRPRIPRWVPLDYRRIIESCLVDESRGNHRSTVDEVIEKLNQWSVN